jgi:hypothetical protein
MMKSVIFLFLLTLNVWAQCPAPKYNFDELPAKYSKVILVPGAGNEQDDLYLGHIYYGKYFSIYIEELIKRNIPYEVLSSSKTGNEGLKERAFKLAQILIFQKEKVLVIGHSLGGLVARLALRNPLAARKVAATVTISTPHEGTPVGDWLLSDQTLPKGAALLAQAFGFKLSDKKYLAELSFASKDRWNTALDHSRHIKNLYSVVAAQNKLELVTSNPLFALGDQVVRASSEIDESRQSDGLVPVDSQMWGECLLFVRKNHGSVLGKDGFSRPSREVLPLVLEMLNNKKIRYSAALHF